MLEATLALLAVLGLFLWVVARNNELFRLQVRGGRVTVVRGHVSPAFLADVRGIVRHVQHATIRGEKDGGQIRLRATGLDARTLQRLRNALGVYPAARVSNRRG